MVDMDPERFEELAADALDALPADLGALMDNVVVIVEDESDDPGLLGLYEGLPLTERGDYGYMELPDRITLFRRPICAQCRTDEEVREEVRITIIHEIAHHFGIDDDRLDDLGWA